MLAHRVRHVQAVRAAVTALALVAAWLTFAIQAQAQQARAIAARTMPSVVYIRVHHRRQRFDR